MMVENICKSTTKILRSVLLLKRKKKKEDGKFEVSVGVMHYYIKMPVALEMIDHTKGVNIFPNTSIGID